MSSFYTQTALSALALVGSMCLHGVAAPASTAKSPQLVGKALTIVCKVTPTSSASTGVVLAQGGGQRGYALYLKGGKPIFFVRQAGKLYTAKATTSPKGAFTLEAHLRKDGAMTLAVNGSVVAKGKAPGLFAVQPQDPMSVGQDTLSAVGDYKAPSPFKGKVQNVKVSTQ
ncbi:hypothetical protein EON83_01580 [bacterium]|nr:MAG: hypothetical protein EON83_01580 [bacterium]